MLEEFVNEGICIKITREDIPRLEELQNALGDIKWESGSPINDKITELRVRTYGYIFINCVTNGFGKKCCNYTSKKERAKEYGVIVTLDEFIKPINKLVISENDLMNVLR